MAKQHNHIQWCNGYRISICIDDNLCKKFRSQLAVFVSEPPKEMAKIEDVIVFERGSRSPIGMAKDIVEAWEWATQQPKGNIEPFEPHVIMLEIIDPNMLSIEEGGNR